MQDLQGEAAQAFYEVAGEVVDVAFGVTKADELFEAYGLSVDTVCLFKKVSRAGEGVRRSMVGTPGAHWPMSWQFDEERTDFPVDPAQGLNAAELTRLLRVHSLELVMEFSNEVQPPSHPVPSTSRRVPQPSPSSCSPQTSSRIFGANIPHHMLLFLNKTVEEQLALRDDFRKAASNFRGKVRWPGGGDGHGEDPRGALASVLPVPPPRCSL